MRTTAWHQILIAVTAATIFLANLGTTHLWDQDEAFFARTAVEMHEQDQWVIPSFNDELFAHKPPFMFWMMRLGYLLFGVTEFGARIGSAVFALGTALLVYHLGRRMFHSNVGLWAGLAMATALMFDVVARAATPDSYLVFFCTLALYVFVRWERWEDDRDSSAAPLPWSTCAAMYAAMALAVLVKGPIGLLLPGGVIGLYLLVREPAGSPADGVGDRLFGFLARFTPSKMARTAWSMRPLTALAAMIFIAGPWFALVAWKTEGQFLREFFGVHNYGRFVSAMDNHSGPIWYYLPAVLVGFFPWSIFGVPTAIDLVRCCRGRDQSPRGAKFLASWIVVIVGFFSLAGTKLPSYVLPAYPALALATACFLDRWLTRPAGVHRWWPRLSFGSLLLVGIAMSIGPSILAHKAEDGRSLLERLGASASLHGELSVVAVAGWILIGGAVAALILTELRRRTLATAVLATTAAAFALAIFALIAVRLDRHQPSPALADAIRNHSNGKPEIAQFGYFRPSLVYYAAARLQACKTPQRVADFLSEPDHFVITTDERYARLAPYLPADTVVIDRREAFPRSGTVIVLTRRRTVQEGRNPQADTATR